MTDRGDAKECGAAGQGGAAEVVTGTPGRGSDPRGRAVSRNAKAGRRAPRIDGPAIADPFTRQQLERYYLHGLTIEQIAARHHCSPDTVSRWSETWGVRSLYQVRVSDDRWRDLYARCRSDGEIARAAGCSRFTVRFHRRRLGLPAKNPLPKYLQPKEAA